MTWKLECDGISESEWQALATMIMEYLKEPLQVSSRYSKRRRSITEST